MSWKMRHVDTVSDMLSRQKEEAASLNSTDLGTQEQAPTALYALNSLHPVWSLVSPSLIYCSWTESKFWISLDRGL